MPPAVSGFNIDEVIRQITAQAVSSVGSGASHADFGGLDSALDQAAARAKAVGELPPKPATLRGAIGFLLVRCVRRMLFWFTPGVRGFHESVIASLTQVRSSLGLLAALEEGNRQELIRFHGIQQENANRTATIQREFAERLDRVEGEVSRLSVRADVLIQLQSSMQQLSQRIDAVGGPEAAMLMQVVERQRGVGEELRQCGQLEQQAREALEKKVDRGTD